MSTIATLSVPMIIRRHQQEVLLHIMLYLLQHYESWFRVWCQLIRLGKDGKHRLYSPLAMLLL